MNRWVKVILCAIVGVALVACGLLVPMHLRAVDAAVLRRASSGSPSLVDKGLALVREQKLGAAQMLLKAAQSQNLAGTAQLDQSVQALAAQHPGWQVWGGPEPRLESMFPPNNTPTNFVPLVEFIVPEDNRAIALEYLSESKSPAVQELLRFRTATNTTIFPPSESSAGSALDSALVISGLLIDQGRLTSPLANALLAGASDANHGGSTQPLEEMLMDFLSLGQRLNWGQLADFVGPIEDASTLRRLADAARSTQSQMPALFAAVEITGQPALVANYWNDRGQAGLDGLAATLPYGASAVTELCRRDQTLYHSPYTARLAAIPPLGAIYNLGLHYAWRQPGLALTVKWLLYLCGGFFIALALHFARPPVSAIEEPLQVRGFFHVAREILFAFGFLLVVLVLSEPFLSQDSPKADFAFHLRLPTVGGAGPAGTSSAHETIMNPRSLLTLLLFFVLQALIYIACLVKLAEIRRQNVPARIKLRLLENEEHLFDSGLYLGFAGTIISLILVSLNIIQPSLMAAYSSTSFGIIFVSIFKIFHLRPARRTLLLESESIQPAPVTPPAPVYATTS